MKEPGLYYHDYLQLDKILGSQAPESFKAGHLPAHDEMLFIIIHQAYELWFKQILFELESVRAVFLQEKIDDRGPDLNIVVHRLERVEKILRLLQQQVLLLDTMTPLDFLDFRNLLTPSSGFQSKQFRLIESILGLEMNDRHQKDYYKRTGSGGFSTADFEEIQSTENQLSILEGINTWLERMPFFQPSLWRDYEGKFLNSEKRHPFWNDYRYLMLSGLSEKEKSLQAYFDWLFFEELSEHLTPEQRTEWRSNKSRLSPSAMRAALFIMLYRDYPAFQHSYRILDSLIEIDHQLAGWRHAHLLMVRRMIGLRVGTGNTSGSGYLEGSLQKHFIFKDLAGLSSFLIKRTELPALPEKLKGILQTLG